MKIQTRIIFQVKLTAPDTHFKSKNDEVVNESLNWGDTKRMLRAMNRDNSTNKDVAYVKFETARV